MALPAPQHASNPLDSREAGAVPISSSEPPARSSPAAPPPRRGPRFRALFRALYRAVKGCQRIIFRLTPAILFPHVLFLVSFRARRTLGYRGWLRSVQLGSPVDKEDRPLPVMPYGVSTLLDQRLRPDVDVLEFGAGYSTLFFMARVRSVVAIEHNDEWMTWLQSKIAGNVHLQHAPTQVEGYCGAVPAGRRFDLISIDGGHRLECLRRAPNLLTSRGVILLDNSDHPQAAEGLRLARAGGFRELSLEGWKPSKAEVGQTTIFYRDGNCLGL